MSKLDEFVPSTPDLLIRRSISMTTKARIGAILRAIAKPFGYSIVGGSQGWIPLCFDPFLKLAGVRLMPTHQVGRTYIDCKTTVAKAHQSGLTVSGYVAKLWNEEGVIEEFVRYLACIIPITQCARILEIGAGTGRFLEPILKLARATSYDVYETNLDWADYLARSYNVTAHSADGRTLIDTPDASQDLVHAHQVFVYLPVSTSFGYFHEMSRVCAEGGFVVFDAYLDDRQDLAAVEAWRQSPANYQVILPRKTIIELFLNRGLKLVGDGYQMKAYVGRTEYLVFRKS
jgi:SAM-dependent methyltransferase